MSATNSQATDDQELDYKAQYKNKLSSLDSYKSEAEAQLAQQQKASRQAAQLSYQKLLKYLPQQTAGYSVGMTETAKIAANNSLQRQLADADAQHQSSLAELNRYVAEQENAAFDQYYQRGQEEKQWDFQQEQWQYQKDQDAAAKTAAAQDFAFDSAVSAIEGIEFDTVDALETYVTSLEGNVSPEQYKVLKNKMDYYKEGVQSVQDENEQAAADKNLLIESDLYIDAYDELQKDGGDVVIDVDGENDIDVNSAGELSDPKLLKRLNAVVPNPKNGRVYYFDGQYFTYHNGTYYELYEEDGLGAALDNYRRYGKSVRNYKE